MNWPDGPNLIPEPYSGTVFRCARCAVVVRSFAPFASLRFSHLGGIMSGRVSACNSSLRCGVSGCGTYAASGPGAEVHGPISDHRALRQRERDMSGKPASEAFASADLQRLARPAFAKASAGKARRKDRSAGLAQNRSQSQHSPRAESRGNPQPTPSGVEGQPSTHPERSRGATFNPQPRPPC